MAVWEGLAEWLEPTLPDIYRCRDCGKRYREAHSSCPECDGEIEKDQMVAYNYWGPL